MLPEDQPPRTIAVLAEGRKGKHEEEARVDVADNQLDGAPEKMDRAAEGDDGEYAEHGKEGDHRRKDEERLVRVGGYDVFLRERLYAVGYRLEEPVRADPVRPEPYLDPAQYFSLRQGDVRDEAHEDGNDDNVLYQGFYHEEEDLHHFTLCAPLPRPTSPGSP